MSAKARTLAKGSVLRMTNFFVQIGIAFIMMPFIIHSLGDRMYGIWLVVGSFFAFYNLFDFGLDSAIQRFLSREIGRKDYKNANVVINTSLFIFSLIGLCLLIFTGIVATLLPVFFKNVSDLDLLRKIVILAGLNTSLGFPIRVFSGILTSELRYDLKTFAEIFRTILRAVCIFIFLGFGHGILALAVISLAASIVYYGIVVYLAKKVAKFVKFSFRLIDRSKIKSLFGYSVYTLIIKFSDDLRFNVDNFVIAAFVGVSSVTVYSIAARLIQYFMQFISSAVGVMIPVFSQYESRGDYESIRSKFLLVTKISSYISMLIGGMLIIFGKAFIERWMGEEYVNAYPLLLVLLIPMILALMQSPSLQLLYGISKHKFFAVTNFLEAIANLILSLILVRSLGLLGVALGTAVPMLIVKLFIQPVYICKVIKLNMRDYYFETLFPVMLKSVIIITCLGWLSRAFIIPAYSRLAVLIASSLLIFTVAIFFIGLNKDERSYFSKISLSK